MLLNRKKVRFWARIIAFSTSILMVAYFTIGLLPDFGTPPRKTSTTSAQTENAAAQAEADRQAAEQSIKELQAQLEKDPNDRYSVLALANAFADAKRYPEAIDQYKKYLEVDPGNVEAQVDMGTSYFSMGDIEKAIASFKKGIEIDEKFPIAWYNLGVAYAQKGDINGQIKAWETYLKLNPNDDQASSIETEIKDLKRQVKEDQ